MITSEKLELLFGALVEFQAEVSNVAKQGKNPFFNSNYARLEDVLGVIREPMHTHGLGFVQFPSEGGKLTTRLFHKSGQYMEETYELKAASAQKAQEVGSALTYQRRYALVSILGLSTADDDGNDATIKEWSEYLSLAESKSDLGQRWKAVEQAGLGNVQKLKDKAKSIQNKLTQ